MRLPESAAIFKAAIPCVLLLSWLVAAPAPVAAEDSARSTLFSCGTDPEEDLSFLSLSGVEREVGVYADLRFERVARAGEAPVYSFPPAGTPAETAFLFSHSDGPEGYLVSIRWLDAGTSYVYYSLDIPPDPEIEDDAGGGWAGLAISRDGRLLERVDCAERPYMFISYLRAATRCDAANPYGPTACADDSPDRQVPLDVDAIGIVP